MGDFKVTKHDFCHFKRGALLLYVKVGGYFCNWDGGGREGRGKKTIIDLHWQMFVISGHFGG